LKFGLSYNTAYHGADPDLMAAAARHAEKCGFESFYMSEHIVMYPGAALPGYVPLPSDLAVADPLECLAYVAAATSTLLLGTAVLLVPYHHPVVLAKQLATIDVLSRGRMSLLTVGLGVLPGEAAAAGVDFRTRGRRADEAIDVLRLLWRGDAAGVSFQGEFFSLTAACSFPKPHDGRILPVHVGGSSLAAARRAGRRGDGYFPGGRLTSEQRAGQITVMRAEAAAAGREPAALEYTRWGQIDMTPDEVQAQASQGVTRLVVSPGSTGLIGIQAELSSFAHRFGLG
jgi:probable F420-dependent oxidoreductase